MPEIAEAAVQTPGPASPTGRPQKRPNVRRTRNIILAVVILALLAVGGVFLYRFLSSKEEVSSEIRADPVGFGSIQSKASGSGTAMAKESAAITLTAGGTVQEVFVAPGDTVTAGQPLYTIFSQEAQDKVDLAREAVEKQQDAIRDRQKSIDDLQKKLEKAQGRVADLTTKAPFAGKLMEVEKFEPEQKLSGEARIAKLVNDRKLKLSLYFSYAYENDIAVGKAATVTIPAVMGSFPGRVEEVHKVRFITPEGAIHFEAVIAFDNPGTLTGGMDASAVLTAADGTEIYPYTGGKTEFYEERELRTKEAGPVERQGSLLNYASVEAGEVLLVQGSEDLDDEIQGILDDIDSANEAMKEEYKTLEDRQKDLEDAREGLEDFNAVSPIDGSVTSCTLTPGAEVKGGDTVITISNTANMVVEITVDDHNIAFISPGLMVELTDWNDNAYMGTVTAINMDKAESSNGRTNYPVTLSVDNYDGSLIAGMPLSYSFVTSQSDDCMMVPTQSVKYMSDESGETHSVVFIRAEEKPENAVDIELPEVAEGETPQYPTPEQGFYPVPVETGLFDTYNVEITSGLNGDEEVFVQFLVDSYYG